MQDDYYRTAAGGKLPPASDILALVAEYSVIDCLVSFLLWHRTSSNAIVFQESFLANSTWHLHCSQRVT
ncbi:hypothetical protein M426DRAFT_96972 [Hypoxylon sp. CI-4A]|nr:hypothetical protein M426DRAFT_96972 [Hypoxylon sp. CI-4A]